MISKQIYESIQDIIRAAGKKMKEAEICENAVHSKAGMANFVTDTDILIQQDLIRSFRELIPEAIFFGEEKTEGSIASVSDSGYTFIIDPIDGTTNFMFGYNHSCISVGLAWQGKMEAGFVYNPYTDVMYAALCGVGSTMNGKRMALEDRSIDEGIVSFGCARYNEGHVDELFAALKKLFYRALAIREGGSAALDLCRVASGSNAAYFEYLLQPYDYAASSLIIEEAGGRISQINGEPITLDHPCSVVAGTKTGWKEMIMMLSGLSREDV